MRTLYTHTHTHTLPYLRALKAAAACLGHHLSVRTVISLRTGTPDVVTGRACQGIYTAIKKTEM